jgi:hypothetical protein
MIVGLVLFLAIIGMTAVRRTLSALSRFFLHPASLITIAGSAIGLAIFISGAISLPKIGTFEQAINIKRLVEIAQSSSRSAGASYPYWTVPESPAELIYKGPIRLIYFLFSPFIWDIRSPYHLIGLMDALLYFGLFSFIFMNRKILWLDPAARAVLIILFGYFFVFGLAVGNFGTGIRHRAKFVAALIVLAVPMLPKLVFRKKIKTAGYHRSRQSLPALSEAK